MTKPAPEEIRNASIQTFLPYRSFERTARCLDVKRLGKQRVETLQILNTLAGNGRAWRNHPAVRMWRGYESVLIDYGAAICSEWRRRGYRDTCLEKIEAFRSLFRWRGALPPWLGSRAFHHGHQSSLLRKNPDHYSRFFRVSADLPFVWPASPMRVLIDDLPEASLICDYNIAGGSKLAIEGRRAPSS